MSASLVPVEIPPPEPDFALTQTQARLRQMVLDSVQSVHSKCNYAKALDDLFPSMPADLSPARCSRNTGPQWITSLHQLLMSACRRYGRWSAKRDRTE